MQKKNIMDHMYAGIHTSQADLALYETAKN